ncbi:MAG: hypothetical protein ACT4R6_08230 [Gemmatimonadaceae bacterium]
MSDAAYRPRSVTEIIDAAFQLFRRDALRYILICGAAYAPFLLFQLVFFTPGDVSITGGFLGVLSYVAGFVAFAFMSAALVRLSSEAYLGREMEIAAALTDVLPRVPAILASTLLRIVLVALATLAFVIPGFWMFARTFALTPVIVLERGSVSEAYARSTRLSEGRKLAILGCYALAYLIFYVITLAFGVAGGILGGSVILALITSVATVIIYPVIGIMEMILYYDARIRAEGYDVELMTQALGVHAARA